MCLQFCHCFAIKADLPLEFGILRLRIRELLVGFGDFLGVVSFCLFQRLEFRFEL